MAHPTWATVRRTAVARNTWLRTPPGGRLVARRDRRGMSRTRYVCRCLASPTAMNSPTLIERVADTTSHRDRDALDRSIVELLLQFLAARAVTLYRVIADAQTRRVARRLGVTHEQGEIGPEALDDLRKLPAVSDNPAWQDCVEQRNDVHVAQPDGSSRNVFPIAGEREVMGLLEVEMPGAMAPRDANLVRGILRILKNQLSLLDYGERDTLTGLLNRKTFEYYFEKLCQSLRECVSAGTTVQPSWLGLVDIDHFKFINDSHGHLFGDEVLLLVSQIMTRTLRGDDQLFRFGGEEFVIVLEEVTTVGAHTAFERVRSAVDGNTFPQLGHVTISLGYTQIRPQDVPATCIERADAALYYAKRNGRNNVREYEELVASGDLTEKDKDETGDVELF
jgi:diguanylate cyclase (GGDEF)-like protein